MKSKPSFKLNSKQRQELWAYAFLIIPIIYFLVFRVFPTLYSFYLSATDWDLLSIKKNFVGLENYVDLLQDETILNSLKNTVIYVVVGVPLMFILALFCALMLKAIVYGRGLFRMLIFLPYVTSTVAIAFVWKWMFMEHGGVVNQVIGLLGLDPQPFLQSPDQAIYVVILNIVWQGIGFYTIILLAGLLQISKSYYEASEIDGASRFQQFIHITIPSLNATIVYVVVVATIRTIQVFTQIYNITGGGGKPPGGPLDTTTSLVLEIYELAFVNYKMGYAATGTVFLFAIIMLITILQMKFLNRKDA